MTVVDVHAEWNRGFGSEVYRLECGTEVVQVDIVDEDEFDFLFSFSLNYIQVDEGLCNAIGARVILHRQICINKCH